MYGKQTQEMADDTTAVTYLQF